MIQNHYVLTKDVDSTQQASALRDVARKYEPVNYYEVVKEDNGICHQVLIEEGFAAPGWLITDVDSHNCSYGASGVFSTGIELNEAAVATGRHRSL